VKVKGKGRREVRRTARLARVVGVEYWPPGNGKRFDKVKAARRSGATHEATG
jgi:hypothetical protein